MQIPFRIALLPVILVSLLFVYPKSLQGAPENKDVTIVQLEQNIGQMNKILKRLYKELGEARKVNDLPRINCLLTKINLVKGLLKAGDRAKGVFLESHYSGDQPTAKLYHAKVTSYSDSAREIERSLDECSPGRGREEGTTLVYIRPEGEADDGAVQNSPWDWNELPGSTQYPAVPPASPFR